MPRKKKGRGFWKPKDRGQHLRRGYVPKRIFGSLSYQLEGSQLCTFDNEHKEMIPLKSIMAYQSEISGCSPEDNEQDTSTSYTEHGEAQPCTSFYIKSEPSDIHQLEIAGCSPEDNEQDISTSCTEHGEVQPYTSFCIKSEPSDIQRSGSCSDDGNDYDIGNVLIDKIDFEYPDPPPDEGNKQVMDGSQLPLQPIGKGDCGMAESSIEDCVQDQPTMEASELDELLQEASTHIKMFLPPHWMCAVQSGILALGCAAPAKSEVPFVIQRSVSVSPGGEVKIFVHNKPLPSCHKVWQSAENIRVLTNDIQLFSQNILNIVNALRTYVICEGTKDHEHAWNSCDMGFIDENLFSEARYSKTFRSFKCLYLVDNFTIKRCQECHIIRNILRQRNSRKQNQTAVSAPPANKGNKYLTPAELKERLLNNRKTIRNLREQNERLKLKVRQLLLQLK